MSDIATASLVLSSAVLLIVLLLSWREWADRRDRADGLSPEDSSHFNYQDRRRTVGIVVMVALSAGLVVGSRLPHKLGNHTNPLFVGIWLVVFLLIFFLLILALIDWFALRVFVRRHRGRILRERVELLKDEAARSKRPKTDENGFHASQSDGQY